MALFRRHTDETPPTEGREDMRDVARRVNAAANELDSVLKQLSPYLDNQDTRPSPGRRRQ